MVVVDENYKKVVVVVDEEESKRNVVMVAEENNGISWSQNLYKCATFYLFLSLHSALEELT